MSTRLVLVVSSCLLAASARSEDNFEAPPRIVAVGDVHGDLGQLVTVLKDAGLVDGKLNWTGGRAHLVQTGDRVDRGPDSRQVMDLMMRLQKQAKKAGGMVHPLTGNHEAMNMLGDLRYTTPAEFAAFKSPQSTRLRDLWWETLQQERKSKGQPAATGEERQRFDAEHPLGWVEQRQAWSPRGTYGSWVAGENAAVRIGDTVFLHGGIGPKYADFSLRDINERIRRELAQPDPLTAVVSQDPEGPLWYRGLAEGRPDLLAHLQAVLGRLGVRRMVVGHTVTQGLLVMPLYGGRVVDIDVGLAKVYGGPPAALVLEGGRAYALHRGRTLPLPEGEGEPLLAYVRAVAGLEPDPARLAPLLSRLEGALSAAPTSR